jgi:hypothetical protein
VCFEEPEDERAEWALAEPFGERVDGDEAAHVDPLVLFVLDDLEIGVEHLDRPAAKVTDPAIEDHTLASSKEFREVRLAEEDRLEIPALVLKQDLKRLSPVATGRRAHAHHAPRATPRLPDPELAERGEMASVFIAAREVIEGVFNGL